MNSAASSISPLGEGTPDFELMKMQKQMQSMKVFWPRDLLPNDIPNARILTYGYDADVVTFSSSGNRSKLSFTQHAHDLMVTLDRELADDVCGHLCVELGVANQSFLDPIDHLRS
jgi:hypothetical protein